MTSEDSSRAPAVDPTPPGMPEYTSAGGIVADYFQHAQFMQRMLNKAVDLPDPTPIPQVGGEDAFALEPLDPMDVVTTVTLEEALQGVGIPGHAGLEQIMAAFEQGRSMVRRARPRLEVEDVTLTPYSESGEVRTLALSEPFVGRASPSAGCDGSCDPRAYVQRSFAVLALSGSFRASDLSATFNLPPRMGAFEGGSDVGRAPADVLALAVFVSPLVATPGAARGHVLESVWAFGMIKHLADVEVAFSSPPDSGDPGEEFFTELSAGLENPERVIPPRSGFTGVAENLRAAFGVVCAVSSREPWQRFRTPVNLVVSAQELNERVSRDPNLLSSSPRAEGRAAVESAVRAAIASRIGALSPDAPEVDVALRDPAMAPQVQAVRERESRAASLAAKREGNAAVVVPMGTLLFEVDRFSGAPAFLDERFAHSPFFRRTSLLRAAPNPRGDNTVLLVVSSGSLATMRRFFTHERVRAQVERANRLRVMPRPGPVIVNLTPSGDANVFAANREVPLAGGAGPREQVAVGGPVLFANPLVTPLVNNVNVRPTPAVPVGAASVAGFPSFTSTLPGAPPGEQAFEAPRDFERAFMEEANARVVEINHFINQLGGERFALTESVVVQVLSTSDWNWRAVTLVRLVGGSLIEALRERDLLDVAFARALLDDDEGAVPPDSFEFDASDVDAATAARACSWAESAREEAEWPLPADEVVEEWPVPPDAPVTDSQAPPDTLDVWNATPDSAVQDTAVPEPLIAPSGSGLTDEEWVEDIARRERERVIDAVNARVLLRALRRARPQIVGAHLFGSGQSLTLALAVDLATSRVGRVSVLATVDPMSLNALLNNGSPSPPSAVRIPRLDVLVARAGVLRTPELADPEGDALGALGASEDPATPVERLLTRRRRAWRMTQVEFTDALGVMRGYAVLLPDERAEWYSNISTLESSINAGAFQRCSVVAFELSPPVASTVLVDSEGAPVSRFVPDAGMPSLLRALWVRPVVWRLPFPFTPAGAPAPRLSILRDGSLTLTVVTRPLRDGVTSGGGASPRDALSVLPGLLLKRQELSGEALRSWMEFHRAAAAAISRWALDWDPPSVTLMENLNQSATTVRLCPATGRRMQLIMLQGAFADPDAPGAVMNRGSAFLGTLTPSFGLRVIVDGDERVYAMAEIPPAVMQVRLGRERVYTPNLALRQLFIVDFSLSFPDLLGVVGAQRDWLAALPVGLVLFERAEQRRRGERVNAGGTVRVYWPGERVPAGVHAALITPGNALCLLPSRLGLSPPDFELGRPAMSGLAWLPARVALLRARMGACRVVGVALSNRTLLVGASTLGALH